MSLGFGRRQRRTGAAAQHRGKGTSERVRSAQERCA